MPEMQNDQLTEDSIRSAREDARLRTPGVLKSAWMSFAETATELPRFLYNTEKSMLGMDFSQASRVLPNFQKNLFKAGSNFNLSEVTQAFEGAGTDINNALHNTPSTNPLDDIFEVSNAALQTPYLGWGQQTTDFFASILGYANPVSDAALIKPSFRAARAASAGISRMASSEAIALARTPIQNFGGKMSSKTYGEVGENIIKAMFAGSAITAPGAMLDNYDKKTDSYNIPGAAEQVLSNGLLSIGFELVPMAAGLAFGKHKKAFGKEYNNPMPGDAHRMGEFDDALEKNEITPEVHEWVKMYLEKPDDMNALKTKGVNMLMKHGYNINHADQKVIINMIKQSHFDDFQSGMMDQIASSATGEFQSTLSDYVAASGIDFFKSENSKFIDGLNGFVDYMDKRLAKEPENLKRFAKARKKADLDHIDEYHELSQKSLLKHMKNVDHELDSLPHAIPKNLRFRALQERKINRLKTEIGRYRKLARRDSSYEAKIDEASSKLRDLKDNRQKHLTTNQELKELENHFLGEKGIPENYLISHDYHRLVDLAHVSAKAEGLLHHVKLKAEYDKQNAYKDFMKYMNSLIENNVDKYADPHKVVDYFKSRAEKVGNYPGDEKSPVGKVSTGRAETSDVESKRDIKDFKKDLKTDLAHHEEILNANQIDIDAADSKELTKAFKLSKERFEQFRDNSDALSQVVSCDAASKR